GGAIVAQRTSLPSWEEGHSECSERERRPRRAAEHSTSNARTSEPCTAATLAIAYETRSPCPFGQLLGGPHVRDTGSDCRLRLDHVAAQCNPFPDETVDYFSSSGSPCPKIPDSPSHGLG